MRIWLLFLVLIKVNLVTLEYYEIDTDGGVVSDFTEHTFIDSFRILDRLTCVAECNKHDLCLTASFNDSDCKLYWKQAEVNDKVSLVGSSLYSKKTQIKYPNLLYTFDNLNVLQSISSFNGTNFSSANSFDYIASGSVYNYFVADGRLQQIFVFDENWTLKRSIAKFAFFIKIINKREIVMSLDTSLFKIDLYGNNIGSYVGTSAFYRRQYFNESSQLLYVVKEFRKTIEVFNANLTLLRNISLGNFDPFRISAFNEKIYVAACIGSLNYILVIVNELLVNSFTTVCDSWIGGIVFDTYGYMAISCRDTRIIHLYHSNGTYLNKNIRFNATKIIHLGFDMKNRLTVVTEKSINIFG